MCPPHHYHIVHITPPPPSIALSRCLIQHTRNHGFGFFWCWPLLPSCALEHAHPTPPPHCPNHPTTSLHHLMLLFDMAHPKLSQCTWFQVFLVLAPSPSRALECTPPPPLSYCQLHTTTNLHLLAMAEPLLRTFGCS